MKYYILFNPLSASGDGKGKAEELKNYLKDDELIFLDLTKMDSYEDFANEIDADSRIMLCGGDGTLNRFINEAGSLIEKFSIYYFASGTGNDFLRDTPEWESKKPLCLDEYLKVLPRVTVKGKTYKFINGVGYGIDGYCCEVGDKLREKSDKPVNYAGIAIKGLLFHYKPTNAQITVDGKTQSFKNVWLAPTMFGHYYGGGMKPTPEQDRFKTKDQVSTMVMYGSGKLKTLMIFPNIFKGTHVTHEDCVKVMSGKEITVKFDRPTALQIDGETVLGVTEYTVKI